MSRQNIESMRKLAAQAEEHDDNLVEKCHGILKRLETERRNREDRDNAIKASLNQIAAVIDQDRGEFNGVLKSLAGEVHQVIASIQGAPVQIDQPPQRPQEPQEQVAHQQAAE